MANGGKILCSGESGLDATENKFVLPLGVEYNGTCEYVPNYMIPEYDALNGKTAYIMYQNALKVKATEGSVEALLEESYFNRTAEHFCSHRHTPNNSGADTVGAVLNESTAYIAWNIFSDYGTYGEYHMKELVLRMIEALIGDTKSVKTNLADRGVVTYTYQSDANRYIAHLLFAHTTKRGKDVEIIEDIIPLYNVTAEFRMPKKPARVYLAPEEEDLPFTWENGILRVTLPKLENHAMIVAEYEK